MTVNDLLKMRYRPKTGSFKRQVILFHRTGYLSLSDICRTLKIGRLEYRRWVRWDYRVRVLKPIQSHPSYQKTFHNSVIMATKNKNTPAQLAALEARIKALEYALETAQLQNDAKDILLDIAKEKYDLDLRKKNGAKQLNA